MSTRFCALLVVAAAFLTGCATPSVHPLYSKDKELTEPGLVGTWRYADQANKQTFAVTRSDDAYRLLLRSNDPKDSEEWNMEFRLVQLGNFRFIDATAPQADQEKLDKQWDSFFLPTHMFARYALDGDRLTIWFLNRDHLEKALDAKKVQLAHTKISRDALLITAETSDLQAFFQANAEDKDLFDSEDLVRVKH